MNKLGPLVPHDQYNQELEANVHPPDWVNPEPAALYNLVAIGGGTAGLVAAAGSAGLGARVALIERDLLGGDCLNVGCVPSKGIISAARVAATMRAGTEFGVAAQEIRIDFGKAMERMRRLRASISHNDSAQRFASLGVDVFLGQGRFTSANTIAVGGKTLRFKKACIATGARAAAPPIPGLDQVRYLTNETVFSLTELPRRFGVIGAGPIGCELAQTFARLGSQVIQFMSPRGVLPKEDPEAAAIVRDALIHDGIRLLNGGKSLMVSQTDDGIRLQATLDGQSFDETVDALLVSVGRAPNVEGLDLDKIGIEFDQGGVKVNDRLQTTQPHIFAAGDICSPYQFTHAADFMARTVITNALFKGRSKVSALTIPWCTYTSPELAHVGLTPQSAQAQGVAIDSYTQEFADVDRAILEGETRGMVRVHCKKGSDEIVGATIVAANAGDMISEITLAMTNKIGLGKIASTIHPYPTQGEAIRKVGDIYNRTRLTPVVKTLFNKWMAWQR